MPALRHLVIVFGDQLDLDSAAFDGFDAERDAVWMAEVSAEATHVWSHKQRIALFLAAMRHFAEALRTTREWRVHYTRLDDPGNTGRLSGELRRFFAGNEVERVIVVEPGEWRVAEGLRRVCAEWRVPLEVLADRHFLCSVDEFRAHAAGRKQLRMEHFYREMRRKHGILLENDGNPVGGAWNFDAENREAFGKDGPPAVTPPLRFAPDAVTRDVLATVAAQFATHPGALETFAWPVTRAQALQALAHFVEHRLPHFGRNQDAMWTGEPFLWHSMLSSSLNLKLLHPREVIAAAEAEWHARRAPLAAVEGFIRQILGWREYVRGLYWLRMPACAAENALEASEPLPAFYWTGETPLTCLRETLGQTLRHGYAHHIQRLMVTGLHALLLGVKPQLVHEWYLAIYVDAVEWVELPNVLGMSQWADGGVMASKPYVATGQYIQRMSNYCASCPKNPKLSTGPDACPFTTLYWDFLLRHERRLRSNHRMTMQLKNLDRLSVEARAAIQAQAAQIRRDPACTGSIEPQKTGPMST